ncbi:hypothetical protein D3C86_1930540 [compost metagenome]
MSTTGAGVPRGAYRPDHAVTSKPGRPASAIVGRSGAAGLRSAEVTAMPCSRPPAFSAPIELGRLSIRMSTWPPITAGMAADEPLNGTCSICRLAMDSKYAPVRCTEDPMPGEA